MAGLQILPRDLARIGDFVLDGGRVDGQQLIDESWFEASFAAGSEFQETCGLLWWRRAERSTYVVDEDLLADMKDVGVGDDVLAKLRTDALGEHEEAALPKALEKALGPEFGKILASSMPRGMTPFRQKYHDFVAFEASGYLGQYLVVVPRARIVAVRMVANSDAYNPKTDLYRSFTHRVMALAP